MKKLKVYTDASYAHFLGAHSAVAVFDDLIVEQSASAYKTEKASPAECEYLGLIDALKLAVKVVKRKKWKNMVVQILCDNMGVIQRSTDSEDVFEYMQQLLERQCNVAISYVSGDNKYHEWCHNISNKFRGKLMSDLTAKNPKVEKLSGFADKFKKKQNFNEGEYYGAK